MAKRYIDTKLWDKAWFRRLNPTEKSVWLYMITRCDHAGILDFDYDAFNFYIGGGYNEEFYLELFKQFADRIYLYEDNTKIWVKTFINFQYGGIETLNPNVRPQKAVIDRLVNQGFLDVDMIQPKETRKTSLENGMSLIKENTEKFKKEFDSSVDVEYEITKMTDWLKSSGKTYKDYEAFARNWFRNSKAYNTGSKKNSKYKPADFKKETGGHNMGYCYECGERHFYNDYQIYGDSTCCKSRILPKRRKEHQEKVDKELKQRGL